MADIKISELTAVSSLNNGDLVEVSQVNELAPSGYTSLKASMADIGKKVNTDIEYTTDLADFSDKTTLGAIKETAKGKNIADEYDDTQTYNKGDVVIYKNTLYICTTNNTTGTWDAAKWAATTVQSLIGSLSSLTTTNKDSLVDAVNEKATIVDLGRLDNSTKTITFSSTVRFLVFSFGGSDSRLGGYACFGRATTSFAQPLLTSSVVTVTPNNDKIAISTSTTNVYVSLVILSGSPDDFVIT